MKGTITVDSRVSDFLADMANQSLTELLADLRAFDDNANRGGLLARRFVLGLMGGRVALIPGLPDTPTRGISNPAVNVAANYTTPAAAANKRWITDYAVFGLVCVVAQAPVAIAVTDSVDGVIFVAYLAGAAANQTVHLVVPAGLHSALGATLAYTITAPAGGNFVTIAAEAHQVTP